MNHSQAFDLALQHLRARRLVEAEALGRQLLAELPSHPDLLHLLGLIAEQAGQPQAGREFLRQAIAANPANAYYHANLGANLADAGLADEAAAACETAIQRMPDLAPAHFTLGNARRALGQWDAAVAAYQTALRLQPGNPATLANLGLALAGKAQFDEAIAAYQAALPGSPNPAAVQNNLGLAFHELGRLDEAIECYRRGLALAPGHHGLHSNLVYATHFHPSYGVEAIAHEHRRWRQQHADPLKVHLRPHRNEPSPDRRLRVGYVSPNFRDHVVGRNLWPLFREHDGERFELVCYSDARQPDAFTARLRALAAEWHEIKHLTDEQLANRIREDRIDILVDVNLHMAQNRLAAFARKPAPIQVTFAGYPGTTGLETIDYRLTDPWLDPPDRNDAHYSEQSIRLPESFWCFDPIEPGPPVNPLPALASGQITFGCLNNFSKINDRVLAVWSRVLNELPGARLLILSPAGQIREHVLAQFERHGVERPRVDFTAKRPRAEYLALHHRLDLMLDTFPYTGHSTSLDALWMGVPVVSLAGQSAVSRGGLSILSNIGLPELVAFTEADYVRVAVKLARDVPRLAALRATLRERLQASPLMDAPRFARNIETAYRAMWHRWCARRQTRPPASH